MMRLALFLSSLLAGLLAQPVFATESLDILSGLNTMPLLINKISGDATIAILYDPAVAASRDNAEEIKAIIDAGVKIPGGGALSALLVGVNELGKLSRAQLAFVTQGLSAHFAAIGTATAAASILTFTTDIDCVRAGTCIIGLASKPNLTLYYSKQAADNAKIEFNQSFAMLVKQP